MSIVATRFLARLAASVAIMAVPVLAWPHAGLVASEPGRRAVLAAPPQQVRLCFNEKVEAKFSTVTVADKAGVTVALGTPATDATDPNCLVTPVTAELNPGRYTVKYKVLSVDGHIVDYGFEFTLKSP